MSTKPRLSINKSVQICFTLSLLFLHHLFSHVTNFIALFIGDRQLLQVFVGLTFFGHFLFDFFNHLVHYFFPFDDMFFLIVFTSFLSSLMCSRNSPVSSLRCFKTFFPSFFALFLICTKSSFFLWNLYTTFSSYIQRYSYSLFVRMCFLFHFYIFANVLLAFKKRHVDSYSAVGGIDTVGTIEVLGMFVDVVSTTSSDLP